MKQTIRISQGDYAKVQEICAAVGAVSRRGPTVGEGSISRLAEMLAAGEVAVVKIGGNSPLTNDGVSAILPQDYSLGKLS